MPKRRLLLLLPVLGACSLPSGSPPPRRPAQPGPVHGTQGMVSTAHPLGTAAGAAVLRQGGNAFDAAVAIAATLNVVEPMMSGMGGYGTILCFHARSGRAFYLDASGKIPRAVDSDKFRAPTPGYMANRSGPMAVSTPGAVHAWEAMSQRFGRLRWEQLFDRAILAAEQGFELDELGAWFVARAYPSMPAHAQAFYGRDGAPLQAGQRLVQRDLANSLRQIRSQGARAIYGGSLGKAIDKAMRAAGGFLRERDLLEHRAEWWDPIGIEYRGLRVLTPSAPAGAFPMLVRLGIMAQRDNRALGHNSPAYLHRFAEVTKQAYWTRLAYSGDPEVKAPPYARLLSEAFWKQQDAKIDPDRAAAFDVSGIATANQNTTHFVVADAAGNVVSATLTLGNLFGSRIMPAGTGIWLNNSLQYCTFEPAGNPMDAHPGRRKLSSDSPSFVLRGGRPWLALGTPGGHTITQTTAQMIMNAVDFGMDIHAAVNAPMLAFLETGELLVDGRIPAAHIETLRQKGHDVRIVQRIGNPHALSIAYDAEGRPVSFVGGGAFGRAAGL